jgi:pantoate--beta-alanine ligase
VILVRTVAEVRSALADARAAGQSISLVPTMGAFHAGHLALMAASRAADDVVVVSLFVNPTQFGPSEDLARYPRDEEADAAAAEAADVDVLFVPPVEEMYPPGFDTWVDPGELATVLEGAVRPGHLALPLEIVACPTVRDPDGLALSSRNRYLSPEERAVALALPRALEAGLAAYRNGGDPVDTAEEVLAATPELTVDYVTVADLDGPTLAAAVRVGSMRLIDNLELRA